MIAPLRPIGIEFMLILAAMTPSAASQVAAGGAEQGWMQFRGPGAMGVAEDPSLPDTWPSVIPAKNNK